MRLPQNVSLKHKLQILIMMICSVALVLACAIFVIFGRIWFRQAIERELITLADLISYSSEAPLAFEEQTHGKEVIQYLRANHDIVAGALYRTNGTVFVHYLRQNAPIQIPPLPPLPGFLPDSLEFVKRIDSPQLGYVGILYLRADLATEQRFLWKCIGVVAGGILLSTLIALYLAARFQTVITKPVFELLQTAKIVSLEKRYDVRATRHDSDELGQLVEGFNEMLCQIQARDLELQQHRDHLEEEVDARTAELKKLNQDLTLAKDKAEQAQLQAEKANRAKSDFLSFMSHELRTPLTSINGFSEMLLAEFQESGRKEWAADLQRILDSGKHLLQLINQVLDLSKIEAGKMELHVEPFNVGTMIHEIQELMTPLLQKKGNRFLCDCPADIGCIRQDPLKVRQSLINLLSNANKFTEKGTVELRVRHNGRGLPQPPTAASPPSRIHFEVADSGIGMSEEQKNKLFQAFSQADSSTSRKYGGTGLGLALSRKFCQMMGGDISVVTELGKGSTFTITLPVGAIEKPAESNARR